MNLMVMNYSMNSDNLVFSHQVKIVKALTAHFDLVEVVTSEPYRGPVLPKVSIVDTNWQPGKAFRNIFLFYVRTLPVLFRNRKGVVFSHMTEVQSMLISPFCVLFRIRHFLWYAHANRSKYLLFNHFVTQGIITSTKGSCPIKGRKVFPIGQAVDVSEFHNNNRLPNVPPVNWYHVGRIDPSKRIELIIDSLNCFRNSYPNLQLHLYGEPSSSIHSQYFQSLKNRYCKEPFSNWVHFYGKLPNSLLAKEAVKHDGFIHAFEGSLDKSLIEAILLKRIVVSSNHEYLRYFIGQKPNTELDSAGNLKYQLHQVYESSSEKLLEEISRKYRIAEEEHSLNNWIRKLMIILNHRCNE